MLRSSTRNGITAQCICNILPSPARTEEGDAQLIHRTLSADTVTSSSSVRWRVGVRSRRLVRLRSGRIGVTSSTHTIADKKPPLPPPHRDVAASLPSNPVTPIRQKTCMAPIPPDQSHWDTPRIGLQTTLPPPANQSLGLILPPSHLQPLLPAASKTSKYSRPT
ncbi:hypothetical protein ScPMuIL_003889 [Solemya velum]